MSNPPFDFSHLTPEERMQLAKELCESLPTSSLPLTSAQIEEIRIRYQSYQAGHDSGQCWEDALKEIERGE